MAGKLADEIHEYHGCRSRNVRIIYETLRHVQTETKAAVDQQSLDPICENPRPSTVNHLKSEN